MSNLKRQPTYALKNMVLALSMHSWSNTEEEAKRLEEAKKELKLRRSK